MTSAASSEQLASSGAWADDADSHKAFNDFLEFSQFVLEIDFFFKERPYRGE